MISRKEISEIKDHLERAQNPIFFYDNDADGLCSYVLLRRFLGRGRGVAIRTHPDIDIGYVRKVQELKADYVFVLDKPVLGESFVNEIKGLGIPIVWLDHHDVGEKYEGVFSYNSSRNLKRDQMAEPVTCICYEVTGRSEDMWLGIMGCIADNFLPKFADKFSVEYKPFWGTKKEIKLPFDAYYKTGIGLLATSIGFGLKDSITNVIRLQNLLIKSKSPDELMGELDSGNSFGKKYREIKTKYQKLVEKAKKNVSGKLLFFVYSGDLSISSEISNELCYLYPNKIVVVAFDNGGIANLSLRGSNVKGLIDKLLPEFEGASGGGHPDAVGARIRSKDLDRFKQVILSEIK